MSNSTTLFLTVFVIVAIVVYFVLPSIYDFFRQRQKDSEDKISKNLDALFFQHPKQWARKIYWLSAIIFIVIGFMFPSSFSGLDRLLLDNAVKFNKQGFYQQTILLLSGTERNVSPLMHNEIGIAYLGVNDVDAAISNFKKATELLPEYALAHANLGAAYEIAGRYTDSEFAFKRSEDLSKYSLSESRIYGKSTSALKSFILRIIFALLFLFIGLKLPIWITNFINRERQKGFDAELPDALKMVGNALKAGMSLQQALEMLVERTKGPIHQEFGLVLKEQRLGKSIVDGINNLSQRIPSEDTRTFANTVSLLIETGGDMPLAIENIAHSIRERKRVKQKISAMTAEGRAQAFMLAAIPIVVGFVMNWLQKETFSLMYTTVLGWTFLVLMLLWGGIGIFLMWKAIQVKI